MLVSENLDQSLCYEVFYPTIFLLRSLYYYIRLFYFIVVFILNLGDYLRYWLLEFITGKKFVFLAIIHFNYYIFKMLFLIYQSCLFLLITFNVITAATSSPPTPNIHQGEL